MENNGSIVTRYNLALNADNFFSGLALVSCAVAPWRRPEKTAG